MSTPEEEYANGLTQLVDAMHSWGEAHPEDLVDIDFPDYVVIGELALMPQEWLKNEAAQQLIRYLVEQVPNATIEQLRTICEGIAQAEQNAQNAS